MPLPLKPSPFPTVTNTKWRIRRVVAGSSSNNTSPQNTKTSWSCSVTTSPTKRVVPKASANENTPPNRITRVASAAVALPVDTVAIATVATEKATPIKTPNELELQRMRNRGFWNRKWHMADVTHMLLGVGTHVLALSAPFVFNTGAVLVALVLFFMTGIGVTLGYHRLLTHRSFKLPKWLEYCFAYCGCHSGQRDPIFWVSVHKNHHKYTDQERDPHSPREGFWFSHFGWFHYHEYLAMKCGEPEIGVYSNVPELKAQWFYRFLHDTYVWHIIGLGVLLYLVGGYPYLAWGMGVRTLVVNHGTFLVGPVCHLWGGRPYNTPDTSTNNGIMALFTFGEGWHNNHHAIPRSARHGFKWWQVDVTWWIIKFLEMVGLATDVYLPTEADRKRTQLSLLAKAAII
ncbi:hypothetical protein E3N88_09983 [Mikania micrantha]|uniref:Fatty acid desaturase domain-containing protein n=1 Tax=Mikania micrantha TaxID=192012 RepID=A0A5N6PB40_9ASTR|nr:hypothetical protein E3N88_09983 [Mikania micrantha]